MTVPGDPIEQARLHAVGLAALASLLADERIASAGRGVGVDPARARALELLPGEVDELLMTVWERREAVANATRSALGQIARAAEDRGGWEEQSDAVLLAQGRASANLRRAFLEIVGEGTELQARLAGGGAILDVGTGVGALARALAAAFPEAHVVGIDIAQRPLELAARELAAEPALAGRVALRQADIATLDSPATFDLVWLPSVFLSPAAWPDALRACRRALTAGGRLIVGLNGDPAGEPQAAARRWLAERANLSDVTAADCRQALNELGFDGGELRPTVPGGPWLLTADLA